MISKGALNFILIIFLGKCAFAQSSNTLTLIVVDADNAVITDFVAQIKKGNNLIAEFVNSGQSRAVFQELQAGEFELLVRASGFEDFIAKVRIKKGLNELTLTLDVKWVEEDVTVEQSEQEKAISTAFGSFLTKEQIDALPDDPTEFATALRQIAGDPNAIIRVDGFASSAVPPKSQISSIRIVRSSFDAENHELGRTYIDITTKVGNPRFSGSLSFNFNDESLNARNAFAPVRSPVQSKNTVFFLSGPIKKDRASFSLTLIDFRNAASSTVNAVLPSGPFSDTQAVRNTLTLVSPHISLNLPHDHTSRISYEYFDSESGGLGIGRFNLRDRAFDSASNRNEFRFSESGFIRRELLNEIRLELRLEDSRTTPRNPDPAILVLDAFNTGGAGNGRKVDNNYFSFSDNILFGYKRHAFKTGALLEIENLRGRSATNLNGTFVFSSLDDFVAGRPSLYSERTGERVTRPSQTRIGAFFQDDIQLRKNAALSAGIRYERESILNDNNNFAPRLGITWSPFKNGKTTLRGGFGIYYRWMEVPDFSGILSNEIMQPGEVFVFNPGFPDPFSGGSVSVLPKSFSQLDDNLSAPVVYHATFATENKLRKNLSVRTNYVYEKGIHQFRSRDLNFAVNGIRPDTSFGRIIQIESSGFFVRNSFNVGLNASPYKSLMIIADYTLSKQTGDNEGIFFITKRQYKYWQRSRTR